MDVRTIRFMLLLQLVSFWPVWRWYCQRVTDGSDEPWGVLALLTVVFLAGIRGRFALPTPLVLFRATVAAGIYAVTYGFLPPLARAAIAMFAVALIISPAYFDKRLQFGVLGLLMVSLPIIASIQFYGGFPVRFLTAMVSAHILGLLGYEVHAQGTLLHWMGELVVVDAPCAGIKMLWAGLYLNFTLAARRNLGLTATWMGMSLTLFSVFIANILRASLLFFTESGIVPAPSIAHQAIGLFSFAWVVLAVIGIHKRILRRVACVA